MKNNKIIYISIILMMASCQQRQNTELNAYQEIKTLQHLQLNSIVDSILKEYKKEQPNAPAYALFLDKKTEGHQEYVFTIAPFSKKVTDYYATGAVNYLIYEDSAPIFIYSGIEDFVRSDSSVFMAAQKTPDSLTHGEFKYWNPINRLINFTKSWSYIKVGSNCYVVKGNAYPFSDIRILPTKHFQLPDSIK